MELITHTSISELERGLYRQPRYQPQLSRLEEQQQRGHDTKASTQETLTSDAYAREIRSQFDVVFTPRVPDKEYGFTPPPCFEYDSSLYM